MSIRMKTTILGGVAAVSILVLVLVSVIIHYNMYEVEQRYDSLQESIFDIRLVDELASEVVYAPGERIRSQWTAQISKVRMTLDRLFEGLSLSEGFKGEVTGRLNTIDRTVKRLSDGAEAMTPAIRSALTTRLNSNRNALFGHLERIEAKLIQERQNLLLTSVVVVASTVLITSILIGFSVFTLRKTMFDAMHDIAYGVEGLKPKDREHPIETTRTDEIGTILRELEQARREIQNAFEKEEEARLKAEEFSAAKSLFVATTSHELRTPLNGLLGCISILEETKLDPEQANLVKMARSSGSSLLSIINDVLDFSKVETGSLELDVVPFQPSKILSDLGATYAILAEKRRIDLSVEFEGVTEAFCIGDPARIRQILSNLVDNAIKFTKEGSVTLTGRVSEQRNTERYQLSFSVSDTGIGISSEQQKTIFEPFRQDESAPIRQYGGSGLGLAISKKLVKLMGGEISVESTPDHGATFTLMLNVARSNGEVIQSTSRTDHLDLHGSLPGLAVLVVDDVDINRIVVAEMLKKWGCTVTEACDGQEAVEAFEGGSFDIVLMDVQMPGMDGVEATRQLRFSGNRVPIIGLTANAFNDQRRYYLGAGMDNVVPKPVDWRELYAVLTAYCRFDGPIDEVKESISRDSTVSLEPRTPPETAVKVMDDTVLIGLKTIMSDEKLKSMCDQTMIRVRETVAWVSQEGSDDRDLRDSGHTMKGMCGNLGMTLLSQLGAELEEGGSECLKTEWRAEVNDAVTRTQVEIERVFSA